VVDSIKMAFDGVVGRQIYEFKKWILKKGKFNNLIDNFRIWKRC
jgi:hypothetical protein